MSKKISAIRLLLALVVLGAGMAIGYIVHDATVDAPMVVSTAAKPQSCKLGNSQGVVFSAPANTYTICLPTGWRVNVINGFSASGGAVTASNADLQYSPNFDNILVAKNVGGSDGLKAFSILLNNPARPAPTNLGVAEKIMAGNVTGQAYNRTQPDGADQGLEIAEAGTQQYSYVFVKDNTSIEINYNRFPGNEDNASLIKLVAESLHFK